MPSSSVSVPVVRQGVNLNATDGSRTIFDGPFHFEPDEPLKLVPKQQIAGQLERRSAALEGLLTTYCEFLYFVRDFQRP